MSTLGTPRVHLRETDSTNARARALAIAGTSHGTLVTAGSQSAGRGRQGRTWSAAPGRSLLMSVVLRDELPELLSLAAGLAVADVAGADAVIKWPNDVLVRGGKLAGILVEARPQEHWAVLGIGVNVAVREEDLPNELRDGRAATLGLEPGDVEDVLRRLLAALEHRLALAGPAILQAYRERDGLFGRDVRWQGGAGVAAGIDDGGRLLVDVPGSGRIALDGGEVHLLRDHKPQERRH